MPDFSRNNSNETMKYGQLIEYNMRTICFEKLCKNVVEKLVPDPLKKTKIKHISGLTVSSFIQFVFSVCPSRGLPTLNLF